MKLFSKLVITLFITAFISKYGSAQPFSGGLGWVYLYGGLQSAKVNTSALFDIDPQISALYPEISTELDLEDDLNFPSSSNLFYVRGIAGLRLQAAVSYMSLHRNGDGNLTRQFAFGDSVYTVGAHVAGYFNTDYYSATLRGSIIRNKKITAGISLGARYLKMTAGIKADSYGLTFSDDGKFNIPLIVPGVHASVYVIDNLLVRGSLEYFSLKYKDAKGKVVEGQISAEYYLLKYLGAGIGYSLLDISADNLPHNDIYLKDIDYSVKGMFWYVAFRF